MEGGNLLVNWGLVAVLVVVGRAAPRLAGAARGGAAHRQELGRAFRDMLDLLAVQAAGTKVTDPMRDPSEIRPGDWIAAYRGGGETRRCDGSSRETAGGS